LAHCLKQTPVEALGDQNLSKLGDSLLNFIYSLNLSLSQGIPSGGKIPNRVLARAIECSSHRELVPRRSDSHRKGDIVEAIFAYAWLKGNLEIGNSVEFIARRLDSAGRPINHDQYARALGELMDRLLDEMGVPPDA
jgi:hypothetical protein